MRTFRRSLGLLLLLSPAINFAGDYTNPYMTPVIINMQTCVQQTMKDCLKSICMASPASCQAQCTENSTSKCNMLSGQHLDTN